ncbi:unnamed protein product [Miscanthus lutarioriparius]|uniref:Uncharacterized protein n=1 Tax=Miscanthus lutarioriparius TaxID=422564 RepID=A0A811RQ32_9POAL|nr:unnamed protein product [Miscanthus lutarioriparius]
MSPSLSPCSASPEPPPAAACATGEVEPWRLDKDVEVDDDDANRSATADAAGLGRWPPRGLTLACHPATAGVSPAGPDRYAGLDGDYTILDVQVSTVISMLWW